jgi:hypothetical protein
MTSPIRMRNTPLSHAPSSRYPQAGYINQSEEN